jgi:ferredoxin
MAKLIFEHLHKEETLEDGSPLGDICEEYGLIRACGQGICGTCIFKVLEGHENLSPPTQEEIDFLGTDGVKKERMACQTFIKSGTVKIKF